MAEPYNCSLSDETLSLTEWFNFICYKIILPPYIVVGLLANLILLIAFYKQSKLERTYVYQVLLTVSKTVEVIAFGGFELSLQLFFGHVGGGTTWYNKWYVFPFITLHIGTPMHMHFIISSLLLATAMSADRVFALSLPMVYRNINHTRHQVWAGVVCLALPALASVSYTWFFQISPEGDHYLISADQNFLGSFIGVTCSLIGLLMRCGGLAVLIMLNITMVVKYQTRMTNAAKIMNSIERKHAMKEVNKTLLLVNLCQSVLMLFNQLPHIALHAALRLAPRWQHCYGRTASPVADAFIFVTDAVDLIVVMSINKKMRGMVVGAVKSVFTNNQVTAITP